MIVLDTDTVSLFFTGHARILARPRTTTEEVAITVISRIEALQGRFATILKAAKAWSCNADRHASTKQLGP